MSTPTIPATTPVTPPTMTFDKWFLTGLTIRADTNKAPVVASLTRANLTNGVWTLMTGPGSSKVIMLDAYQQAALLPDVNTAMNAIVQAVITYATAQKLL